MLRSISHRREPIGTAASSAHQPRGSPLPSGMSSSIAATRSVNRLMVTAVEDDAANPAALAENVLHLTRSQLLTLAEAAAHPLFADGVRLQPWALV